MNGKQIYIRLEDYNRLKAMADEYRRSVVEQLSVILDVFEREVGHGSGFKKKRKKVRR